MSNLIFTRQVSFFILIHQISRTFFICTALLLIVTTSGCVHHFTKSDFPKPETYESFINSTIADSYTSVRLSDDSTLFSDSVKLLNDSVICQDIDYPGKYNIPGERINNRQIDLSIPQSNVNRIVYSDHNTGLLIGLFAGCTIGGFSGFGLFSINSSFSNSGEHKDGGADFLVGALIGSVAGGLIGGLIGDYYIFDIRDQSQINSALKLYPYNRLVIYAGYNLGNKYAGVGTGSDEFHTSPYSTFGSSGNSGYTLSLKYLVPLSSNAFIVPEVAYSRTSSNETYFLSPQYNRTTMDRPAGSSDEVLRLASFSLQGKINFVDLEKLSFYGTAGPGFSWVISKESGKEKFLANAAGILEQTSPGITGSYRSNFWYGTAGFGTSLRYFSPIELFMEINYNFDLTSRFQMYYDNRYYFRYDNFELKFGTSLF